jgi:glycosyltransferase involved in cell wall biosynthesis
MKTSKRRIIHILHELKFSGAEIMYVDAAPFFQERGCDLLVVATGRKLGEFATHFENAGYIIFHKPYPILRYYLTRIRYYRNFIRFLKNEKIDCVHIHSNGTMWGMAMCAWLANVRSVYTFHSVFSTNYYSYVYHFLLRWSAKLIFQCRFQTISDSVYENELALFHNNTTKISNWYGNNRFYPASLNEKCRVRKELNIKENILVIISVGGCNPGKQHCEVLLALEILVKTYPEALFLGTGETETSEKSLAIKLGVSDNVRFLGNQSNVRNYLIASDIYIMPSKKEGMPITTIEAMACNLPAILYNVPGLRDFNKTGMNSILIPEDHKILAETVNYLFSNKAEAEKISLNGKHFVENNFNMVINAGKIFDLYGF